MYRSSQGLLFTVLMLASFAACTQYKPSTYRGSAGTTNSGAVPGTANADKQAVGPQTDVTMTLANTKLTPVGGALKAKITFAGQTLSQDFTPSGTQSALTGLKLPQSTGILTVEIYQGESIRFIAKKANTTLGSGNNTIVVDDCLILRTPWVGTTNEGSCEWTITEN